MNLIGRSVRHTAQHAAWYAVWHAVREAGRDLAALVWPVACVGCGAADRELCWECHDKLEAGDPRAIAVDLVQVPAYARGTYTGVLRSVIVAYKHGGRYGFVRQLGTQLQYPLTQALTHATAAPLIVTAPSRAASVRCRGYRHVDEVVKEALRGLADFGATHAPPELARALKATRGRKGQVGLDAGARAENASRVAVSGAWHSRLAGREVIVVDDILTTGATLRAACDVLIAAGSSIVAVVTLATVTHESSLRANPSGTGDASWSSIPERRNGALERPTRLTHLGGHHGREHPRQERRHY